MVYYLKYRPQSLADLVGQELIASTLQKALESNRLAHAYLFCGPRGVGKTSTARILAKMVNCQVNSGVIETDLFAEGQDKLENQDPKSVSIPCNKCSACLSITNGSSMDLIEIDAASNRGIDDIRQLRDRIKLSPTHLKKKVYIIDEVHMLTNEAFNALLKTLEEPPEHCLFILATTEVQKIPQTILSRVQRLDFQPASTEALIKALKKVVEGEKIGAEDEALRLIAHKSDGSFRDGVKLLDQLSSSGEKVTAEMVEKELRNSKFESVIELLNCLAKKDTKSALEMAIKEAEEGVNLKEYVNSIMELMRLILLIKHNVRDLARSELSAEKYQVLENLSKEFTTERLVSMLGCFQDSVEKLKFTSLASLPIEIAIIESCIEKSQESGAKSQDSAIASVAKQSIAPSVIDRHETKVSHNDNQDSGQARMTENKQSLRADALKIAASTTSPHNDMPEVNLSTKDDVSGGDLSKLHDKWTYVLETVKPYNYSLEAMLRSVKIGSCEDGRVTLKVPYSFHQRILETPRNRDLLESVLSDVLGKQAKVYCELDTQLVKVEDIANVEMVAADDEVIRLAAEIFNS